MSRFAQSEPAMQSTYGWIAARLTEQGYHVAWVAVSGRGAITVECWLTYDQRRRPGIVLVLKYPAGVDVFGSMFGDGDTRTLDDVLDGIGVDG